MNFVVVCNCWWIGRAFVCRCNLEIIRHKILDSLVKSSIKKLFSFIIWIEFHNSLLALFWNDPLTPFSISFKLDKVDGLRSKPLGYCRLAFPNYQKCGLWLPEFSITAIRTICGWLNLPSCYRSNIKSSSWEAEKGYTLSQWGSSVCCLNSVLCSSKKQ